MDANAVSRGKGGVHMHAGCWPIMAKRQYDAAALLLRPLIAPASIHRWL